MLASMTAAIAPRPILAITSASRYPFHVAVRLRVVPPAMAWMVDPLLDIDDDQRCGVRQAIHA